MITAIISIVASLLILAVSLFSIKDRKERRKLSIWKQIQEKENELGKALTNNDTVGISRIGVELDKLRKEYRFLDK